MHQFKDSEGREWSLSINVGACKRLKESALKLDLLDDNSHLKRFGSDTYFVIDVAYFLCLEQCQAAGVSEEQFVEAMNGDGVDAILAELLDFFRRLHRQAESALLDRILLGKTQAVTMAVEKITGPEMDSAIQASIDIARNKIDQALSAVGNSSGNSPESLDSTPTHEHSAS